MYYCVSLKDFFINKKFVNVKVIGYYINDFTILILFITNVIKTCVNFLVRWQKND